jgi:hypothetical protein
MRQHVQNEDFVGLITESRDEPVFIAADVENDAILKNAGIAEHCFDVGEVVPIRVESFDSVVPVQQRGLCILMARHFPKFL